MLDSDTDKKEFELWLSAGLKKPVAAPSNFTDRVLNELDAQKARQLLSQINMQEKICKGLLLILILSGLGSLLYPPVAIALFTFLQTIFTNLIELILEPTLTGLVIPVAVIVAAVGVVWNLIEMVSLE